MAGFFDWLKWEFGRRIELTPGVKLIILDRFAKAAALTAAAVSLLVLGAEGQLTQLLLRIQSEYQLDPGTGLWGHVEHFVFGLILKLPGNRITDLAIAGLLYAALEAFEGVGLLARRRWAEYLVLLATLVFLPLEIDELHRRITVFRVGALLINVAIVVYLVRQKELFIARRSQEPA